jgi:diadenosine tetraphosphate (Ap4A) HIT family hydrolase
MTMSMDTISNPIGNSHDRYDCILCSEITGDDALSSIVCESKQDPAEKKFLFETDNLVLIRDISPIVSGHCLIVTRRHMCGFAEAGDDVWRELTDVKRAAVDACTQPSLGYFFFEHGTSRLTQTGGACIAHAHIHFIPTVVDMPRHLALVSFEPLILGGIEMRSALSGQLTEYLYYEDMNGKGCVVHAPKTPLKKQFVRVAVATELGLAKWDWVSGFLGQLC